MFAFFRLQACMVVAKLNKRANGAETHRKPARPMRFFRYAAVLVLVILFISLGMSLGYISKLKINGVIEGAGCVFCDSVEIVEKHRALVWNE